MTISIVTLITGITLFARLAQSLFRPHKVPFDCPRCGLARHDQNAVKGKACGLLINIPTRKLLAAKGRCPLVQKGKNTGMAATPATQVTRFSGTPTRTKSMYLYLPTWKTRTLVW